MDAVRCRLASDSGRGAVRRTAVRDAIPLTGQKWAAAFEAYAVLVSEHLSSETRWLDVGTGNRLLGEDLDPLENYLVGRSGFTVGMDMSVTEHRNIQDLVNGSVYDLPFADSCFDLVTCNVVMEHLADPRKALAELARILVRGGALVINTPNLLNYGVLANACLSKLLPEKLRLRLVRASDSRAPADVFPVQYRANTLRRLKTLFAASGFEVHRANVLPQQRAYFRNMESVEKVLMMVSPGVRLLVCAHKID